MCKECDGQAEDALKKGFPEDLDYALGEVEQICERWNNRLTVNNLAFAKRYLENEVCVCIEFRLEEHGSKKFVSIFQRERPRLPCDRVRGVGKVNLFKVGSDWNKCAVFIDDVQLVETPKGVAAPGSVWLQPSDEFFDFRTGVFEECRRSIVGKTAHVCAYWEVSIANSRLRRAPASHDEGSGQRVERRPDIVDNVSDVPCPFHWNGLSYRELVDMNCGFRVFVDHDTVRVSGLESSNLRGEVTKVFLGPV